MLKQRLAATTDRYLEQQAELLDSTIDCGALAKLAALVTTGTRRSGSWFKSPPAALIAYVIGV